MKKGTSGHPKTKALARALNIRLPEAVGILQLLWEFCEKYSPDGAIGKFSDSYIAEECCWTGDAAELISALTSAESRWVDEHPEFRLLVHDWPDHCEDSVHNKMARARRFFANGAEPKLCRLGKSEKEELERFYTSARHERSGQAHSASDSERTPRAHATSAPTIAMPLPKPIPMPKPRPEPGRDADARDSPSDAEISEAAQSMYALHPKKKDAPLVPESLVKAVARGHSLQRIQEVHAAFCKSKDWRKDGGRYAPKLAMWLTDDGFTGWPADIPKPQQPIDESRIIPCVLVPPPEEEFRLGLYDSPAQ